MTAISCADEESAKPYLLSSLLLAMKVLATSFRLMKTCVIQKTAIWYLTYFSTFLRCRYRNREISNCKYLSCWINDCILVLLMTTLSFIWSELVPIRRLERSCSWLSTLLSHSQRLISSSPSTSFLHVCSKSNRKK